MFVSAKLQCQKREKCIKMSFSFFGSVFLRLYADGSIREDSAVLRMGEGPKRGYLAYRLGDKRRGFFLYWRRVAEGGHRGGNELYKIYKPYIL